MSCTPRLPHRTTRRSAALLALLAACGGDDSSPRADAPDSELPDATDAHEDADGGGPHDAPSDPIDPLDTPLDGEPTEDVVADTDSGIDAAPPCAPPVLPPSVALGTWSVALDPTTLSWRVEGPDGSPTIEALARCETDAPALVRIATGEPTFRTSFGRLDITWQGSAAGLQWSAASGPGRDLTHDDTQLSIIIPFGDAGDALLRFELLPEGDIEVRLHPTTGDTRRLAGELRWDLRDGSLFGLGSQVTTLDLRGRTYPLHVQEQGNGKPQNGRPYPLANVPEAAYAPMGVLHSADGWSGVVSHDGVHELDLGRATPDALVLRSYPEPPGFVFVTGQTPVERMSSVTRYTGRPPAVPDWAFFPWNDTVGGPAKVRALAQRLREEGIPSSAIWAEDWIGGSLTANGFRLSYAWVWDEATYPDLPTLVDELEEDGFAFLAYFNTFVPSTLPTWPLAVEQGYLVTRPDGSPYLITDPAFRDTGLVDLTNASASAYFAEQMRIASIDLGIRGWMADFTEWMPVDGVLSSGIDPWTYRNLWPLDFQRLNRATRDAVATSPDEIPDFVFFARSGWASRNGGTAGLVTAMWMGDQMTSFDREDGLATTIPIGVHLGLSGVSLVGSDIAGYQSIGVGNTTKELFFRWTSLGALTPLMRTHQGSDKCLNWTFDRDDETLDHYRRWATVHALLLPEWRRLHTLSQQTGIPILRHPWLVFPEESRLWADERLVYFVGDDLYVAPVHDPGVETWTIQLPEEGWWPLFGTSPLPTGTVQAVEAAASELPVFVRPGTALELLPDVIDTIRTATSGATDGTPIEGRLRVQLYPAAGGSVIHRSDARLPVIGRGIVPSQGFSDVTIDGVDVPACSLDTPTTPCLSDEGVLRGVPASARLIAWGDATLEVGASTLVAFDVAIGGGAWPGDVHEAPSSIDLDSDAPPSCTVD